MFSPENKLQLRWSAVPTQIWLLAQDWSCLKEFQQLFKMGPIWFFWLYSFRSRILPKIMLNFRWEHFFSQMYAYSNDYSFYRRASVYNTGLKGMTFDSPLITFCLLSKIGINAAS